MIKNKEEKYDELKNANIKIFQLERELEIKNKEIERLKKIIEGIKKESSIQFDFFEIDDNDINSFLNKEMIEHKKLESNNKDFTVLVVEDNEISKQIAISFLSKKKYRTICAKNGKIALELLENNNIDIILMDLEMPVLNGYETTKIIRAKESNYKHIPIIAMTAYSEDKHKEMCLSIGIEDYISKPFSSGELYSKIEKYLPVK